LGQVQILKRKCDVEIVSSSGQLITEFASSEKLHAPCNISKSWLAYFANGTMVLAKKSALVVFNCNND
jgi:hypothetical protein